MSHAPDSGQLGHAPQAGTPERACVQPDTPSPATPGPAFHAAPTLPAPPTAPAALRRGRSCSPRSGPAAPGAPAAGPGGGAGPGAGIGLGSRSRPGPDVREVDVNSAAEREAAAALLGARESALSGGAAGSGRGPLGAPSANAGSPAQAEVLRPLPIAAHAAALRGKMSDPRSSLASTSSGIVLAARGPFPGTPGTPGAQIRGLGAAAAHTALPAAAGATGSGTALDTLADAGDAAERDSGGGGGGGLRAIAEVALASVTDQEVRGRHAALLSAVEGASDQFCGHCTRCPGIHYYCNVFRAFLCGTSELSPARRTGRRRAQQ